MPLTDIAIKNLKPKSKSYKKADFEGLYIAVMKTGSMLWSLKYRYHGVEKRLSFGKYPDVSLQQARKLRDEAQSVLASGADPVVVKQNANVRLSLAKPLRHLHSCKVF